MNPPNTEDSVRLFACVREKPPVLVVSFSDAPPALNYLIRVDMDEIRQKGGVWLDNDEKRPFQPDEPLPGVFIVVGKTWIQKHPLMPHPLYDGRVLYLRHDIGSDDLRENVYAGYMQRAGAFFLVEKGAWQYLHKRFPCVEDIEDDPSLENLFGDLTPGANPFFVISIESVLRCAKEAVKATKTASPHEM